MFESMMVSAGLSSLGEMQLNLLSPKTDLKPEDLLGKTVTVSTELREGAKRHLNGHVTRFGISGQRGSYYVYAATVRPWLWFLTRTSDCRIFQEMTVPDIVKKVFGDHSVASFEFKLFRSYRTWTYCVQYRETDYNFVARLLEHEGIYWYFEHSDGKHKLILVDSQSAHDAAPGLKELPYVEDRSTVNPDTEYISDWRFARQVTTGKTAATSYDFERPSVKLDTNDKEARKYDLSDYEIFDWQGDYVKKPDGQQWTEDRLDELQTTYEPLHGMSNAHGIEVGRLLKMLKHPREDQNAEFLVTALSMNAQVTAYESGGEAGTFQCDFSAIPSKQQYRPPRRTPKPFVQGPQSAVVTGPSGEEIYTDKYGRVKVQFHWDREAKKNEKTSCWVRVSHPWAGKNFGVIHIPRMGQEVIVDFLEGDPDQPIITGRVYNAEQMPPWDLPANATQSGILTRSSKGGGYGNANAIRFEDKAGSEQVWIHAEKNQDIEVEHDETHWVGHDRTKTIDHDETTHVKHDRTETVDNNETITIGVDRAEKVGNNEKIKIGVNRTENVGSNETIDIGANRTISVGANETAKVALQRTHLVGINETIGIGAAQEIGIGAFQAVAVGAYQTIQVGAYQSTSVGANQSLQVGVNQSIDVGANETVKIGAKSSKQIGADETRKVGGGRTTDIGTDDKLKVANNLVMEAGDSVTIKTGSASITMKSDGTITIKGKDVILEATSKINESAANITSEASAKSVTKGSMVELEASGVNTIKGSLVKIN